MARINYVNLTGALLIFIALMGPWFNFNLPMEFVGDTEKEYHMGHVFLSPFALTVNLTYTSNVTIYTDIGVIAHNVNYFYNPKGTLFGALSILGALMGIIGEFKDRRYATLSGGMMAFLSTIFFFLVLPPQVLETGWVALWGFWVSLMGSTFILVSVAIRTWILRWEYKEDSNPYEEP